MSSAAAESCSGALWIVLDEAQGQLLPQGRRLALVLDVGGLTAADGEGDVRDATADYAIARIGVDAERGGAGVGRLADDVARAGVAEDRELYLSVVDDGDDIASGET